MKTSTDLWSGPSTGPSQYCVIWVLICSLILCLRNACFLHLMVMLWILNAVNSTNCLDELFICEWAFIVKDNDNGIIFIIFRHWFSWHFVINWLCVTRRRCEGLSYGWASMKTDSSSVRQLVLSTSLQAFS